MKPIFQKLTDSPEEGFAFKVIRSRFDCPWHFHREYELILILKSGGYRLVGDHMAGLRAGDLVLVGPNVPHIYRNEEEGKKSAVHAMLIQFEEKSLEGLLDWPVMGGLRKLLQRAKQGLHVTGGTRARAAGLMQEMPGQKGLRRMIGFLQILDVLAGSGECRPLASAGFLEEGNAFDQERMDRVCQYIHARLDQPMFLPDLAKLVSLSEGAFSRFFRSHTGKTFPNFVNELRIGRACRLLAETEKSVTEVAFGCGFSNLSNFNRQFLRIKRVTPREYRQKVVSSQ